MKLYFNKDKMSLIVITDIENNVMHLHHIDSQLHYKAVMTSQSVFSPRIGYTANGFSCILCALSMYDHYVVEYYSNAQRYHLYKTATIKRILESSTESRCFTKGMLTTIAIRVADSGDQNFRHDFSHVARLLK